MTFEDNKHSVELDTIKLAEDNEKQQIIINEKNKELNIMKSDMTILNQRIEEYEKDKEALLGEIDRQKLKLGTISESYAEVNMKIGLIMKDKEYIEGNYMNQEKEINTLKMEIINHKNENEGLYKKIDMLNTKISKRKQKIITLKEEQNTLLQENLKNYNRLKTDKDKIEVQLHKTIDENERYQQEADLKIILDSKSSIKAALSKNSTSVEIYDKGKLIKEIFLCTAEDAMGINTAENSNSKSPERKSSIDDENRYNTEEEFSSDSNEPIITEDEFKRNCETTRKKYDEPKIIRGNKPFIPSLKLKAPGLFNTEVPKLPAKPVMVDEDEDDDFKIEEACGTYRVIDESFSKSKRKEHQVNDAGFLDIEGKALNWAIKRTLFLHKPKHRICRQLKTVDIHKTIDWEDPTPIREKSRPKTSVLKMVESENPSHCCILF